jgi:hypothetical protein
MSDLSKNPSAGPVYFLHIPKTAGTSLTEFLQSHFDPDASNPLESFGSFLTTPRETLDRYQFLGGHFYFDVEKLLGRRPRIVTVLRDPVERAISHYHHARRETKHYAHEIVKNQSLLDFARDPRMLPLHANYQTRYLGLELDHRALAEDVIKGDGAGSSIEQQLEGFAPGGFDDPAMLDRARRRLAECAFVGIAEWLDPTIQLLAHQFGWPLPAAAPKRNLNFQPPSIDDETAEAIAILRRTSSQCAELYRWASRDFAERWGRFVDSHPELGLLKVQLVSDDERLYKSQIAARDRVIENLRLRIIELEGDVERYRALASAPAAESPPLATRFLSHFLGRKAS